MEILGRASVEEFARKHSSARKPLAAWSIIVDAAAGRNLVDLQSQFPSADYFAGFVVFNIGGNKFRLVSRVDFLSRRVLVRAVLTHAQYSKGAWKP